MIDILSGAIIAAYGMVGLFFLRFWRDTHDRLFRMFAVAFWLLAIQRVLLYVTGDIGERGAYLYIVRLAAYLLIIFAVLDKNRART